MLFRSTVQEQHFAKETNCSCNAFANFQVILWDQIFITWNWESFWKVVHRAIRAIKILRDHHTVLSQLCHISTRVQWVLHVRTTSSERIHRNLPCLPRNRNSYLLNMQLIHPWKKPQALVALCLLPQTLYVNFLLVGSSYDMFQPRNRHILTATEKLSTKQ